MVGDTRVGARATHHEAEMKADVFFRVPLPSNKAIEKAGHTYKFFAHHGR